jgi:hypothetical protein
MVGSENDTRRFRGSLREAGIDPDSFLEKFVFPGMEATRQGNRLTNADSYSEGLSVNELR